MSKLKYPLHEVLCFSHKKRDRGMVRRYYKVWREQEGLPDRCDIPACRFHTEPLIWNGEPLKLELDHVSGNSFDNRPENLRYICPNCHRQTDTHGGANIGRVQNVSESGYELHDKKTGRKDANVILKGGEIAVTGHAPIAKVTRNDDDS